MRYKSNWATVAIMAGFLALFLLISSPAFSDDMAKAKAEKAQAMEKATYLIISPHTQEECLSALDAVAMKGEESLGNWHWGCMAGDHTGYAFLKAETEESALSSVPESLRSKARAVKVDNFTMAQIKQFHEKHAESKGH
ncbi:MAG: hypothetical protein A2W25_00115 [candidate division Zixibacteria bacterium RBG_16_53_22]|nr:MAG: hypothetical protein A2W25_00115 [candidate division Zixibacteria bacterium RBG_16_53_22]